MLAILFGLSMDHEIFLLSRVREEYVRTGDNTRSLIEGVAGTGRDPFSMAAVFSLRSARVRLTPDCSRGAA